MGSVEPAMRTRPTWWFVMVGSFLVFNLLLAIVAGGRWNWIAVAVLALLLALAVWQGRRRDPPRP